MWDSDPVLDMRQHCHGLSSPRLTWLESSWARQDSGHYRYQEELQDGNGNRHLDSTGCGQMPWHLYCSKERARGCHHSSDLHHISIWTWSSPTHYLSRLVLCCVPDPWVGKSWALPVQEGHLAMCYFHWLIKKLPWTFDRPALRWVE